MEIDVAKYDANADSYSRRYRSPEHWAARQFGLLAGWGRPLPEAATVVELGCADGFVTQRLAAGGMKPIGVDIAPRMVAVARHRLANAGLDAEFYVTDIRKAPLPGPAHAVLAVMGSFFRYMDDDVDTVLKRFREVVSHKVIVDFDPREISLPRALEHVQRAGFDEVSWRPLLIFQRLPVGAVGLSTLRMAETVPGLRRLALRRRGVIKGEVHS